MPRLRIIATAVFLVTTFSSVSADTIDKASVDRATREVDRPLIKDEYMWSIRRKPVIKDESGRAVSEEEGMDGRAEGKYDAVSEDSPVYPAYR